MADPVPDPGDLVVIGLQHMENAPVFPGFLLLRLHPAAAHPREPNKGNFPLGKARDERFADGSPPQIYNLNQVTAASNRNSG